MIQGCGRSDLELRALICAKHLGPGLLSVGFRAEMLQLMAPVKALVRVLQEVPASLHSQRSLQSGSTLPVDVFIPY